MTKIITAPKKFDCEDKLGFFGDKEDYELAALIRDELNRRNPYK